MPVIGWYNKSGPDLTPGEHASTRYRINPNTGEREEVPKEKSYYAGPLLVICALGISAYVIAK